MVALHNRSLAVRPAAFTPLPADDDTWKQDAAALIRRAAMIVVLVKRSEGLQWEPEEIRTAQRLNDTVFFLFYDADIATNFKWLMKWLGVTNDQEGEEILIDAAGQILAVRMAARPTVYKARLDRGGYALTARRAARHVFQGT